MKGNALGAGRFRLKLRSKVSSVLANGITTTYLGEHVGLALHGDGLLRGRGVGHALPRVLESFCGAIRGGCERRSGNRKQWICASPAAEVELLKVLYT